MRRLVVFSGALAAVAAFGSEAMPVPQADPDIQKAIADISADRVQRSIFVLASFKTRSTLSDTQPSGDGIGGAASWIRAEFERISAAAGGRLKVELDTFTQPVQMPRIPHPISITNVVATLPGTSPDSAGRIYIMCGHYDSRSKNILDPAAAAPGADDDASGIAATLEAARVLSRIPIQSTLVFIAFAGEEQGLNGSAHWAQQAKQKHLDIEGVLNNDIIGNSHAANGVIDRHLVRLFAQAGRVTRSGDALADLKSEGIENDSPARELARAVCDLGALYVPTMKVRLVYRADRYLRGGDHVSFLAQGYPGVRFTEPSEDFRHEHEDVRVENGVTYGDTPDFVDFGYVADVARVNAAALAGLARAPAPPKEVQIETARLENDTTLRWAPNTEANLAGYRIVWRETTAPFWEHSLDVAKEVTRKTVPYAKDDYIFGVEAFDSDGHVSPAVYPSPRMTL